MPIFRWFRADVGSGIDRAYDSLSTNLYKDGNANGFIIDRRRRDFVEARFVEANLVEDIIRSPFGEETAYKRIDYRICEFFLDCNHRKLMISYSGTIPKSFFTALSSAFNFEFYYETIQIDVEEWMHCFASILQKSPEVGSVSFVEYPLGSGVTATITVKGRNGVLEAANKLVNKRSPVANKIDFRLLNERGSYSLSRIGIASMKGAVSGTAKEALLNSLELLAFGSQHK